MAPILGSSMAKVEAADASPIIALSDADVAKVDGAYNDAMRAAPPHPSNSLGLERLVFFSDAVIAIGITLLAIDLRLPHTPGLTNHGLLGLLRDMVPRFVAFVISFAVIGVYWAAHHRMFRFIAAFDQ